MNATQKFYTAFTLALLVIVGASFGAGYAVGTHRSASLAGDSGKGR